MKTPVCKQCGEEFARSNSLQKTCSYKCLEKLNETEAKEKRKTEKMKKAVSVAVLKKKLWTLFSEYIRLKHSDSNGMSQCVTCKAQKHYKELQAGHFVPAGSSNYLRFVENNVHPQCYSCNCMKHGNLIEYRIYMIETYGEQFTEQLIELRNEEKRFTSEELQGKIEEYKDKIEALKTK